MSTQSGAKVAHERRRRERFRGALDELRGALVELGFDAAQLGTNHDIVEAAARVLRVKAGAPGDAVHGNSLQGDQPNLRWPSAVRCSLFCSVLRPKSIRVCRFV